MKHGTNHHSHCCPTASLSTKHKHLASSEHVNSKSKVYCSVSDDACKFPWTVSKISCTCCLCPMSESNAANIKFCVINFCWLRRCTHWSRATWKLAFVETQNDAKKMFETHLALTKNRFVIGGAILWIYPKWCNLRMIILSFDTFWTQSRTFLLFHFC